LVRLVLADALHYGITKYRTFRVIDLATLTVRESYSARPDYAGLSPMMTGLAEPNQSGRAKPVRDKVWRLAAGKKLRTKTAQQPNAIMKNIGGPGCQGRLQRRQFLQRFVGKDTPWAASRTSPGTGM